MKVRLKDGDVFRPENKKEFDEFKNAARKAGIYASSEVEYENLGEHYLGYYSSFGVFIAFKYNVKRILTFKEIMGLLEDFDDFKFDFNPGENVKVNNESEARRVLEFLSSNGANLSVYLKQIISSENFSEVVREFGYIGRLKLFNHEVSAIMELALDKVMTFDEYNERFIKEKESKEEIKMKETKYYDIPAEIMEGISSLSELQRRRILEEGIVINYLEPKATEEQIKFVYDIICEEWKARFRKAFPEALGLSNDVMYNLISKEVKSEELEASTNSVIQVRANKEYAHRGFWLKPSLMCADGNLTSVKWKVVTDSNGQQVLIAKELV